MSCDEPTTELHRRTVLASAGGAAVALAAGTGTASASEDLESWMDDVPNYEGVADHTGEDEVGVTVGADNGLTFDPPAIRVDPGTTVVWEWTGEGGDHDVAAEDDAYASDLTAEAGFEFEHTFEEEGVSLYGCTPHIPVGMKGAVVVGDPELEAGGASGIPTLPGVAAALAIIAAVTVGISKWAGAGRDDSRV